MASKTKHVKTSDKINVNTFISIREYANALRVCHEFGINPRTRSSLIHHYATIVNSILKRNGIDMFKTNQEAIAYLEKHGLASPSDHTRIGDIELNKSKIDDFRVTFNPSHLPPLD